MTWPDAFYVTYDHLVTGETSVIRETGATSGIGVLATFAYDDLGRRTSLTRGNGMVTSYSYDPVSRLQQQFLDLGGSATANDLTLDFAYNPASQIASTTRSNDIYAWTGHGSGTISTTANGLNQLGNWVNSLSYDAKGNVTGDGTYTYAYSSENLLTSLTNSAPGAVQSSSTYAYDPLMRLAVIDSSNSALDSSLGYDGHEIVVEALSSNRTRRYVFGPAVDEPLVAYLVTSTGTSRTWYTADERGSTVRLTDDSGAATTAIGRYDEYGAGLGASRFQYTGQYWLGDNSLHYYRARVYDPKLGRFLQPDPIGYGGGMNMYAYVGGDPINRTDPLGLDDDDSVCIGMTEEQGCTDVLVTGKKGRKKASADEGSNTATRPAVPSQTATATSNQGQACAYRKRSGMCIYIRDKSGKLQPTPEMQEEICKNYEALTDASQKVADGATVGGVLVAPAPNPAGVILGGLATFSGIVAQISTGGGLRPLGLTIVPKQPPPPGC